MNAKIIKDSVIYLIGEIIAKTMPFLLLPYLTRRLDIAGFGELSFYQTLCSLLVILFSLSQDAAVARYFYVYGKRNLLRVVQAGYLYTFCSTLLALSYAYWTQSLILAIVILTAATQSLFHVQLTLRQCQKHALAYIILQLAVGIGSSLLTITLLEITNQYPLIMRFTALLLTYSLVTLLAYRHIRNTQFAHQSVRFHPKRWLLSGSYILSYGIPLLLHNLSGFTKGQLDRIFIYQHYTTQQLGIYAAALQLALVINVLLAALNKAILPHYFQAIQQQRLNARTIRCWALWSLSIVPLPALIAYWLPESFFLWILGKQYIGVHYYICLFLLGFALALPYYLLVNFLFYYGRNKQISLISVLSTLIYLVVLWLATSIHIQWIPFALIAGSLSILPLLFYYVRDPADTY